jgi:hypothetical protein
MNEMNELVAILVRLRYVAYPVVMVCGSGLAIVAYNRMRQYYSCRKTMYRALVSISLSLALLGLVGWLGVVSYESASVPPPAISVAYSMIVIWLAGSLLWLAVVVMREELAGQVASRPKVENGRKVI